VILRGKRVLLLEDEPLLLMHLEDIVREFGCEILANEMKLEPAMRSARNLPLDFAILDINVGGETAEPVAEILEGRGIPFLFATGYDGGAAFSRSVSWPRLGKPYHAESLHAALSRLLADSPPED
jgi:DNA-binding NarL/FixJ family response regulator